MKLLQQEVCLLHKTRVGTRRNYAPNAAPEAFFRYNARVTAVIGVYGGIPKHEIGLATFHFSTIRQTAVTVITDSWHSFGSQERSAVYADSIGSDRDPFARQTNNSLCDWISISIVIKINLPTFRRA